MAQSAQPSVLPVTICVVTFNSAATIDATLRSIAAQEPAPEGVIVIDNRSTDDTLRIVQSHNVDWIAARENRGFAAGMNAGIARVYSPYVVLMNPDVILERGCLSELVLAMDEADERVAGAQPKLFLPGLDDHGRRRIDGAGIVLSLANLSPHDRGHGAPDDGRFDEAQDIFGPTGALAIWRVAALRELATESGVFDERFFAYYEDVDLAWRAQRRGWRFLYVPTAKAVHARKNPPAHGPRVDAIAFANRFLLLANNASWAEGLGLVPRILVWELPRLIARGLTRPDQGEAWRRLARYVPATLKKRLTRKAV